LSEFINRTTGHVRIENRVGSGFAEPGPGCPNNNEGTGPVLLMGLKKLKMKYLGLLDADAGRLTCLPHNPHCFSLDRLVLVMEKKKKL